MLIQPTTCDGVTWADPPLTSITKSLLHCGGNVTSQASITSSLKYGISTSLTSSLNKLRQHPSSSTAVSSAFLQSNGQPSDWKEE